MKGELVNWKIIWRTVQYNTERQRNGKYEREVEMHAG